jgi:hypothetical protein
LSLLQMLSPIYFNTKDVGKDWPHFSGPGLRPLYGFMLTQSTSTVLLLLLVRISSYMSSCCKRVSRRSFVRPMGTVRNFISLHDIKFPSHSATLTAHFCPLPFGHITLFLYLYGIYKKCVEHVNHRNPGDAASTKRNLWIQHLDCREWQNG